MTCHRGLTRDGLVADFADYVTEVSGKYRIGGVTDYLSRFNMASGFWTPRRR